MKYQEPLVFLHSSMSTGMQWQALRNTIDAPSFAPDISGYGRAPMPAHPREIHQLAFELELLEDQLPDMPFHLVGHSYGAATAIRIARTQPERVKSLTLFEPVAFYLLPQDHAQRQAITTLSDTINRFLALNAPDRAAASFIDYWNTEGTFDRLNSKMQLLFTTGITKVAYDFSALLNESCNPEELSALTCPTLLLEGQESPDTVKAVMQVLKNKIAQAEHYSLACGHMGPVTHPELVNPLVSQFIATHNKAS